MTDQFSIEMVCCTSTICEEVAAGLPQSHIAISYALAMRSEAAGCDTPDWRAINRAILSRWRPSGLERIKKQAHRMLCINYRPTITADING